MANEKNVEPPAVQRITSRIKDVGGIPVARALPVKERRLIGAWCFLDHAGPSVFRGDADAMHVGPHPHTGLQTFTWMLQGELLHRDSLGYEQIIRPGQVNLMTAGRGIAHSENSVPGERQLHAAQLWIALPEAVKNIAPRFDHYPRLPQWQLQGVHYTLLTGEFDAYKAPTLSFSPLVAVDASAQHQADVTLALRGDFEYGVFVLEGEIRLNEEVFIQDELAYLGLNHTKLNVALSPGARILLLGGEPLGENVMMWWNFVGRSKQELQQAVDDWNENSGRFGEVAGDTQAPTPAPQMP